MTNIVKGLLSASGVAVVVVLVIPWIFWVMNNVVWPYWVWVMAS